MTTSQNIPKFIIVGGKYTMRVADFFCGGGGFSEGFRQAGFEIVFAVDRWEPAVLTYKGNKPGVNVIQDDVIRISELDDDEFERIVPDSEVIIGSPPCQAFSNSNKSGNGDKSLGIKLIEAYLRIIARKKYKPNSVLKYWVLENVPSVKTYIKEKYTATDLGLDGEFALTPHCENSGIYNAKYYGAPTNRQRYLCGEFPKLQETHCDENVITLGKVLESLGEPLTQSNNTIIDINYPNLKLFRSEVTDHEYIYRLAPFEWNTAKRLKEDKGYMGRMSFPENLDKPARTVMATMSASSREAMILKNGKSGYRLPTVREVATMMSFPIDYWFYGKSKATKHTLVGNAVPPKMSYAVAKAIALDAKEIIPSHYKRIEHAPDINFYNLNGEKYHIKKESPKREGAKFKYHIPYLILSAYRVEFTNYHSVFADKKYLWDAEIHFSQGKDKAKMYQPQISEDDFDSEYLLPIQEYINNMQIKLLSYNDLQKAFCMTSQQRKHKDLLGPYEILECIKKFISKNLSKKDQARMIVIEQEQCQVPLAIIIGYYILKKLTEDMGGLDDGRINKHDTIK